LACKEEGAQKTHLFQSDLCQKKTKSREGSKGRNGRKDKKIIRAVEGRRIQNLREEKRGSTTTAHLYSEKSRGPMKM